MKKSNLFAFGTLLLLPYLVSIDGDSADASNTFVEFALSKGMYADVSRDCSGNVVSVDKRDFWDVGAKVVHNVSILKLTAGAGATTGDRNDLSTSYQEVNPMQPYYTVEEKQQHVTPYLSGTVGLNTKYFGLDAGGAFLLEQIRTTIIPAVNIRLGTEDLLYLSCGVGQNTALFGGNSVVDLGLGINLGKPNSLLWLGIGGIPYDGGLFSAKLDLPISDRVVIQPRVGIGLEEFGEYSIGLGTRIAF